MPRHARTCDKRTLEVTLAETKLVQRLRSLRRGTYVAVFTLEGNGIREMTIVGRGDKERLFTDNA